MNSRNNINLLKDDYVVKMGLLVECIELRDKFIANRINLVNCPLSDAQADWRNDYVKYDTVCVAAGDKLRKALNDFV